MAKQVERVRQVLIENELGDKSGVARISDTRKYKSACPRNSSLNEDRGLVEREREKYGI